MSSPFPRPRRPSDRSPARPRHCRHAVLARTRRICVRRMQVLSCRILRGGRRTLVIAFLHWPPHMTALSHRRLHPEHRHRVGFVRYCSAPSAALTFASALDYGSDTRMIARRDRCAPRIEQSMVSGADGAGAGDVGRGGSRPSSSAIRRPPTTLLSSADSPAPLCDVFTFS